LAKENNEMRDHELNDIEEPIKKKEDFVNKDMIGKIEKIENQMVADKPWQLKGEVQAKMRPLNSLLEEVLDFNVASKLPPTITKEKTSNIESVIK
jgi:U3 small nucleolar RNA-associated protein MPP10